jgi:hypothetical protein
MDRRWLFPEQGGQHGMESDSASEILALAQKLQADATGLLTEQQVIEMGRELGLEPRYVREAIRLRQPVARVDPAPAGDLMTLPEEGGEPLAAVGRALAILFALAMVPASFQALDPGDAHPTPFFALFASTVVGWVARYPRLAGAAGATTVPIALLIYGFYHTVWPWGGPGLTFPAVFFTLLAFGPLCWATARGAAGIRRWAERQGSPREWRATER